MEETFCLAEDETLIKLKWKQPEPVFKKFIYSSETFLDRAESVTRP